MQTRTLTVYFLFFLIFSTTLIPFWNKPANAQNDLYVYIDELPEFGTHASNVMYESTQYWKNLIPNLHFYQVDNPAQADFRIQWVKEFGVEHVGYAYGSQFIEVGLGDSNCGNNWNPFSANYVAQIMKHEIGHILGYTHSNDFNNIMYPVATNYEYGIIKQDLSFVENYAYFVPVCSSKSVTSFNYNISTDDPVYGFDVYFVPDNNSLNQWGENEPFEYYADSDQIALTYTFPDGTTNGNLAFPTREGNFESILTLDKNSPKGMYELFTSFDDKILGVVTFEVVEKLLTQHPLISIPTPTKYSPTPDFVDPKNDPYSYIDRYNNEKTYREWFDINYKDYTIYEAVELKNPLSYIDSKKDPQHYLDRYNNEPKYREWFEDNFPNYTIYEAIGIREPLSKIPSWLKYNAQLWSENHIDDQTFMSGIQYMIEKKFIVLSEFSKPLPNSSQNIPSWAKSNAELWHLGILDDDSFLNDIEFLIENGIIILD